MSKLKFSNGPKLQDISTIKPYENNVKKHPEQQIKKLAQSIKTFGWQGNPIIVDKDGVIISGHGRRLAALELGLKQVPVVVADDMTAAEARAFRLADNRVAISDIDTDMFEQEISGFKDMGDLLEGIFDAKELDFAVADLMEINDSVFEEDLTAVVQAQEQHTDQKIKSADDKPVQLVKVLGLQGLKVPGSEVIHLSRFVANLQAETGEEDIAAALLAHAKEYNQQAGA